jgi:uncharacterized membrane protein YfcA
LAAGAINAVVGSGTLITFPVLLAVGYPPVVANVSNTVGLVLGSVAGAYGYRRELARQRERLFRLGWASAGGGLTGGALLLVLPKGAFKAIVPALIVLACALVVFQPRVAAWLERRRPPAGAGHAREVSPLLFGGVFATGVYGGYFGAAQGVMLIAILGLGLRDDLHRVNAAKNVLASLVNGVAAVLFIVAADVAWRPAGLIAVGSVLGGVIGARLGRRLPPNGLRAIVVGVGVVAFVRLVAT